MSWKKWMLRRFRKDFVPLSLDLSLLLFRTLHVFFYPLYCKGILCLTCMSLIPTDGVSLSARSDSFVPYSLCDFQCLIHHEPAVCFSLPGLIPAWCIPCGFPSCFLSLYGDQCSVLFFASNWAEDVDHIPVLVEKHQPYSIISDVFVYIVASCLSLTDIQWK